MVHLRPGRRSSGSGWLSRRDEALPRRGEPPVPLRQPKPGPPARVITRREEIASNAAWARARLQEKLRGAVSWTEAAGLGVYGAVLLLLLGQHAPDGAAEGLPLRDPASPVPLARGGSDPSMQLAEAGTTTDTGAEVPGMAAGTEAAPVPGWAPGWDMARLGGLGRGVRWRARASPPPMGCCRRWCGRWRWRMPPVWADGRGAAGRCRRGGAAGELPRRSAGGRGGAGGGGQGRGARPPRRRHRGKRRPGRCSRPRRPRGRRRPRPRR